ncbi:glycosidase [Clavibacter sp. Sh2126]|uniref:glycosidase n=1 Tax=Clavibacter sp. Sh2126 TaxID=3397678 RepID=UPI0039E1893A
MRSTELTTDPAAGGSDRDDERAHDARPAADGAPAADAPVPPLDRAALAADLALLADDRADALADALVADAADADALAAPAARRRASDDPDLARRTGGSCYVDRYAGDLPGLTARIPYLVELGLSHLEVTPVAEPAADDVAADALLAPGLRVRTGLGSARDLADLADGLHDAGLTLAVELSPTDAADLPDRIRAAAHEAAALASAGADLLRVDPRAILADGDAGDAGDADADAARAAALLRVLAAVARRVSPGVALAVAADAPGAPAALDADAAVRLVDDPERTALVWEALATRSPALLSRSLERRGEAPAGTAWTTRVRDLDALRWAFDDDDARALGIDPDEHRRFLTDFHLGRFAGSHARGVAHPAGVAGTTASLAGLEQDDPGAVERILLAHSIALSSGGLPILVLGDEVGQLNDYGYDDVPAHADDSRWVNRPLHPFERYDQREDRTTSTGVVHAGIRRLVAVRGATPALGGTRVVGFDAHHPHVLGYQRPHADGTVLVLANLGDEAATVEAATLGGFAEHAVDLVRDERLRLTKGIVLSPRTFVWLQAAPDLA